MIRNIKNTLYAAAAPISGFFLALMAGFFLSDTRLAGVTSFADISLAGGVGLPYSAAVLTGSLVHCIVTDNIGRNIVKISAMIMILIMKLVFELDEQPRLNGIATGVAVFLSGMAVSALIGELIYKTVFYIFYGTVAGVSAYSVSMIISGISKKAVADLTGKSGCAYAVIYTIAISVLSSADTPVINAGITAGAAVTLYGAYFYGSTGGVMCGALTVCGAFLGSPVSGTTIVLLPAAGMLTGYIKNRQYIFSAVFFGFSEIMLTILAGLAHNYIDSLINITTGAMLFAVTAPAYSDKWIIAGNTSSRELPDLLSSRMTFLSDTIGTVRTESQRIASAIAENADRMNCTEDISGTICKRCFRRLNCWKKDQASTLRGFSRLSQQTEFSAGSFPYELSKCLHKPEISQKLEEYARERAMAKLLETRFSESQQLMFEHMGIMEEMTANCGERLDVRYSEAVSRQVRSKLGRSGIKARSVIAYYNSRNRLHIELYFSYAERPEETKRVRDLISDELGIPLTESDMTDSGKEVRLRLYERQEYSVEVYGASKSAEKNGENGDTSCCFTDGSGVTYVILSDGMGSGKEAAVQSRLVVRMFRKLITAGVDFTSAIKLINSIMLTKSPAESFATLDVLRIDLDTCELTVIKSGASATLISHRGNVMKIASPTFPVGIYEHTDIFYKEYDFEEGDTVIMFSDGISENEYLYIKELLLNGSDLKRTVDEICLKSDVFSQASRPDDVTVIGVKAIRSL